MDIHLTPANVWLAEHAALFFGPVQALHVSFNSVYQTGSQQSLSFSKVQDKLGIFVNDEAIVALLSHPASSPADERKLYMVICK